MTNWCHAEGLDSIAVQECPLWENKAIDRKLAPKALAAVLDFIVSSGRGEVGSTRVDVELCEGGIGGVLLLEPTPPYPPTVRTPFHAHKATTVARRHTHEARNLLQDASRVGRPHLAMGGVAVDGGEQ